MQAFGIELTNRDVIREDGSQVGKIQNVKFNPSTGQLTNLVVQPAHRQRNPPFETTRAGNYKIPARLVKAVDDCIVVER